MDITVYPGKLKGTIKAIPSKSQAHRLLICAAFSGSETTIICEETNRDIEATVACLRGIGTGIIKTENGYHVIPAKEFPCSAHLDCAESGSTLRFLLPIVCALGIRTTFQLHGRLPCRPLSPLWEELECMGCRLTRPTETSIQTEGKLHAGVYNIAGNISSQFISGLLFALALLDGQSEICIEGKLESAQFVFMTQEALKLFGVSSDHFCVGNAFPFKSPGHITVDGDWSNGAFFAAAKALGHSLEILNLNNHSLQGDREVARILNIHASMPIIPCADIPDLVPILSVYFAAKDGAIFTNIERLRIKESDRVEAIIKLLSALGIHAESSETVLTVYGGQFHGGIVDACNDHRIAMSTAIAATVADGPVTILGAECVAKSYPAFWQEFQRLGGIYEQYIR